MEGEDQTTQILRTVYSTSLLCPLAALLSRTPLPATDLVTRQALLEIASGSQIDAELLTRALLASGCLQPVPGASGVFQVDGTAIAIDTVLTVTLQQ